MEHSEFIHRMTEAKELQTGSEHDFWAGYQIGTRRLYHGDRFGTDAEHEKRLNHQSDYGRGYRCGFSDTNVVDAIGELAKEDRNEG